MDTIPVLLVLGPSGAGKSTLGGFVRENLGFVHLEMDVYPGDNAVDRENLRPAWDEFYLRNLPGPLAIDLRRRARDAGARGVIATFPSPIVFSEIQLGAAEAESMAVLVLYGTREECLNAFLEREARLQRGLDADHWRRHNDAPYARFGLPAYARRRVSAFSAGTRRSRQSLLQEVEARLAMRVA